MAMATSAAAVSIAAGIAPSRGGHPIADQLRAFERDPLAFLTAARREHGDVVRLNLWPELVHLVSHPDGVRRILDTNRANYHDMRRAAASRSIHPTDLAATVRSALGRERIHRIAPDIVAAAETGLDAWDRHARDGRPLDVAQAAVPLTLRIFCRTIFATDIDEEDVAEVGSALTVALREAAPHRQLSSFQRLEHRRAGPNPELDAARHVLRGFVGRLVEERRAAGDGDGDVLSALVFGPRRGAPAALDERQLREAVMIFLLAGHTTARALAWTMYVLVESDAARARLEHELAAVLGGRTVEPGDLPTLPSTRMILQEAMRLYPPIWMLAPRRARADDVIGGYGIPRGSLVLVSPYVTHRHPDFWPDPERFEAERFAHGSRAMAYLPFGAGPWSCLGSRFALFQARLVLAMIAQRYRWELARNSPVEPEARASLWPRGGLAMTLHSSGAARV